jgi:4-amino-4-deoxy-L-arabinose transferase-like glycosyltransferase
MRLGDGRGLERATLGMIVCLAIGLRVWRLDQNGFGTEYYSAGVRSMLLSAHNFLFNAFDPAGFLSLDKPPLAFWIQVLSAKLLGFDGLSLLLPQALEGVVSVLLLHRLVRQRFGAPAGLLAALFLAVLPVGVAADRSSNTDSCLVMVLLLAAWAVTAATARASGRLLALGMALVGLGFNVKMLAAFLVLPSFALTYLVGAPVPLLRRTAHLAAGGLALVVVSLAWIVPYDLVAPSERPYAGSTRGNSMLELAVVQYGLERLVGRAGLMRIEGAPDVAAGQDPARAGVGARRGFDRVLANARGGTGMLGGSRVPAGPLRLLTPQLAVQFGWLLPLALFGVLCPATMVRRTWPLTPQHSAVVLWTAWALTSAAALSAIEGVFHTYYLVVLGPPVCALAGIGASALWIGYRRPGVGWWLLPLAMLVTAAWQAWIEADYIGWRIEAAEGIAAALIDLVGDHLGDWRIVLYLSSLAGAGLAALALSVIPRRPGHGRAAACAACVGGLALLATPTAWALSTVLVPGDVWFPAADLALIAPDAPPPRARQRGFDAVDDVEALGRFLDASRRGERFALATMTAVQAAPIIVRIGEPVMAIGGYGGSDPIVTLETLKQLVAEGQVRFFLLGADNPDRTGRRRERQRDVEQWIRDNGRLVEPTRWRSIVPDTADVATGSRPSDRRAPVASQLFDLGPIEDRSPPRLE